MCIVYAIISISGKYVPVLKESVCYIVAAVVTNDHQEVLMMQEAKKSCRGKWYLPAGRVEPNETLEVRFCLILCVLSPDFVCLVTRLCVIEDVIIIALFIHTIPALCLTYHSST